MSKKWTKLPRGMTWKQINFDRRERIRKMRFVDGLKHGDNLVTIDFETMTHDGTNFNITAIGSKDFVVTYP